MKKDSRFRLGVFEVPPWLPEKSSVWRGQQGALWGEVRSGAGTSQRRGCGREKRAREGILVNSNI